MQKILFFLMISFLSFGQNPNKSIGFIENKGQIVDQNEKPNTNVKYLLNSNGLNVQLRNYGFSYDVYQIEKKIAPSTQNDKSSFITKTEDTNFIFKNKYHRIDIDFINCNTNVLIVAELKSTDFDNYFTVDGVNNGVLKVYKFKKITYKNIYDNIDVVFFTPEDTRKPVEYNFVIHPGGKISDIQMHFKGAKTHLMNNKIKMKVDFGIMEETVPLSWIEGNKQEEIAVFYKKTDTNTYGFESTQNLDGKKIIIDPVPIRLWGTYYGGSSSDRCESIDVDNANNVYISGYTNSANNIATAGAYQSASTGGDGYIAKLDSNGNRIWGSYYPFSTLGMRLDGIGNIYIYSKTLTANPNIPSPGCFQSIKNNFNDTYLIKLDNNGFKLWGTYYGGSQNEVIHSISFDASNNIYLSGETNSPDVFSSPGAYQVANASTSNVAEGFIAKFDTSGNRIWGTFYGSTNSDGFLYCNVSADGFLYLAGTTNSSTGISTPGSYQPLFVGGQTGMIIKFDLNGQRIWGTYICNNATLLGGVLKGNEFVFHGTTFNQSGIATPNTLYPTLQNSPNSSQLATNENSYLCSFNVQTQQKNWATYFPEKIRKLDLNQAHEVYFSGDTNLDTAISTPDGYMPIRGFYYKTYLVKLSTSGLRIWGTYYGGNMAEQLGYVKLDNSNNIFLYGLTNGSTTGIATLNANQTVLGSNPDTFLVKFRDCLSATTTLSNSPICINSTLQLSASGGTNYAWTGPNNFTSNLQNPTILNANAANSGSYICAVTGTGGCDATNTITVVVGDTTKPIPDVTPLPTITGNCTTVVSTVPTATDNCAGIINATTGSPLTYSLPGNYTITWNYNDGNGNTETQTQNVTITAVALPSSPSPQNFCIQQNATLNDITVSGLAIKWYDAATGGNLLPNTTLLLNGTTYYASQTINSCESLRISVLVNIINTSAPTGNATQTFCATQNPTLSDIVTTGTSIIWYGSLTGVTILPNTTLLSNGATYYATQTLNSCESTNRLAVTVSLINTLNATNYLETICDNLNDGSEIVNLTSYNSNLISSTTNCNFEYYVTLNGATNQTTSDLISNFNNYNLLLGVHTIYVRITSSNGCSQIVSLKLRLVSNPVVAIPNILPLCENNILAVNAGANFDSYLWSTAQTSQSIIITQPGNYSVTVTQNHGAVTCSSTKNFTVFLSGLASITSIETIDWTNTQNQITILTSGLGDYEYSIDGIHYQDSNQFTGLNSGAYIVYVKDKNDCGEVRENVFLLMYPYFFTPNGDGNNDFWNIKFSQFEPNLKIAIYDRMGKLMKTLSYNSAGWDGTYNGVQMLSDDYWFVVTRQDGTEHRGHFALKR